MVQAWALEQEAESKRKFEDRDVLVPWKLQSRFVGGKTDKTGSGSSAGGAVSDADTTPSTPEALVFQRFCHVYEEGELEGLADR